MTKNISDGRKKIDLITTFFIFGIFVTYFLVPKSFSTQVNGDFRLFSLYLQPWFLQRYLLIALCLTYTAIIFILGRVALTRKNIVYILFIILFIYFPFTQSNFTVLYAVTGILTSYCLLFQIYKRKAPRALLWLVLACTCAYVCQYFFYRVSIRVTSSFLDPNIAGYYLFLCYVIFRAAENKWLSLIALFCGALSLSRNFYLAVIVFEVLSVPYIRYFVRNRLNLKSPLRVSLISVVLILMVSFIIVGISNPNETIGSSSERLLNINDGSNYSRAMANLEMIKRLADGDFWLNGLGNEMDTKTEHRPHNAFLRAIYRYGVALSLVAFVSFFFVMKYNSVYNYSFFISIFSYYTLLNDFITGPELTLMLCVGFICHEFKVKRGKSEC